MGFLGRLFGKKDKDEKKQEQPVEKKVEQVEVKPAEKKAEAAPDLSTEIKEYKVFRRNIMVTNPQYIQFYKNSMSVMKIRNKLIGNITDEGKYIITDDIKKELIAMDKEIEDSGEDFYRASTLYMKKRFLFNVKIRKIDSRAMASLYLYEYVADFLADDYVVSHIADFVDVYNDKFIYNMRKAFNLVDVDVLNSDLLTPRLAVILQSLIDAELVKGDMYELAAQGYLVRMLEVLEERGDDVALEILEKYKQEEVELDEKKTKFENIRKKAILDKVIDEYGGLEKVEQEAPAGESDKITNVINNTNNNYEVIEKGETPNEKREKGGPVEVDSEEASGKIAGKKGKVGPQNNDGGDKPQNKKPQKNDKGGSGSSTKQKKPEKKEEKKDEKTGGGVSESTLEKIFKNALGEKNGEQKDSSKNNDGGKNREGGREHPGDTTNIYNEYHTDTHVPGESDAHIPEDEFDKNIDEFYNDMASSNENIDQQEQIDEVYSEANPEYSANPENIYNERQDANNSNEDRAENTSDNQEENNSNNDYSNNTDDNDEKRIQENDKIDEEETEVLDNFYQPIMNPENNEEQRFSYGDHNETNVNPENIYDENE